MSKKPDSVIKHQKFEELMARYHGQIENALYAMEQLCPNDSPICINPHSGCLFSLKTISKKKVCGVYRIRGYIDENIEQHDITIPEDNTQAERKKARFDPYCEPRERTLPECEPCRGRELTI